MKNQTTVYEAEAVSYTQNQHSLIKFQNPKDQNPKDLKDQNKTKID